MKTITDDSEGFFESGGWTFLDPESDGEDAHADDSEDEEDDVYEPTDDDTVEESESDSEYSEASEDGSEDSEDGKFNIVFNKRSTDFKAKNNL